MKRKKISPNAVRPILSVAPTEVKSSKMISGAWGLELGINYLTTSPIHIPVL